MSLYPSLEDMKVDRMYQAQFQAETGVDVLNASVPSAPYPTNTLPYPLAPNQNLYPSLSDYMGLELSPSVIAANMPEYLPQNQVVSRPLSALSGMVAPLSGNDRGLQRAHVTNGIGELSLCKQNGKIGLRVQAVNNGIFVSLVSKDSPAAKAGLRFGDQLLQVQHKDVAGMSASAVHDLIKKGPDSGLNIVMRDRPLERTVTLHKDSSGKVGFSFKDGKITHIVIDSSAARNGLLTEHQLLEVNGQNVVGLKDKEISKIIAETGTIVTVTIIPSFIYEHMTKKIASSLFDTMDHSVW